MAFCRDDGMIEREAKDARLCSACVYASENLDPSEFETGSAGFGPCGLDANPNDSLCLEMRTDNCSIRAVR